MSEVKPNTTATVAGTTVRIEVSGDYYAKIASKGGIALWPEKTAESSGVVEPQPDRFWEFQFDNEAAAQAFAAEHAKKVQEADAALAVLPVTAEVK